MKNMVRRIPSAIQNPAPAPPPQLTLPWRGPDRAIFAHVVETERQAKEARKQKLGEVEARQIAARRAVVHSVPYYPTVFVAVPRAVFDRWWPEPWGAVLAAAEQHLDGLTVETERPRVWRGTVGEGRLDRVDVAFLAEGQDDRRGRTVLFQQNW